MSCLFCKNFQAIEPPEHRLEREARTCEFSCGNKWDAYTAAYYVKEHKLPLVGFCHLNPAAEVVRGQSMCAKFEDGFYESWHIGQPEGRENIWDWAQEKMETHMRGSWETRELKQLQKDNAELKAALTASRRRSAARLARLNKAAKKNEPAKRPPLRLVAAE